MGELYADHAHQTRSDQRIEHLRLPPQSVEAEQAVLGGLMLTMSPERTQRAWDEAAALLTESSFYRHDHQLIWRAMRHLRDKQRPIDSITVGEFLQKRNLGSHVGNGAYLIELASTTPSAAFMQAHAQIVADKAQLRRVIEIGTEMVNAGFDPDGRESVEIIGKAQTQVAALLQSQPADISTMSSAVDAAFTELSERNDRGEGMDGLPTGFTDFDEILGGLVPGVHFIGGRPKHGKSTLAQNIGEYVALVRRKPVHVVILEMSEKQFAKRVIASVGGVDSQRMRRGTLNDADWAGVSNAARRMRGAPMFISKPGSTRIEHICAQIRRQHAETPLGLAVLDYLQLVDVVMQKGENYSVAVGRVTRSLVNLAQELQIPILVLSQLNRESEKDKGRPTASQMRDSGSIEADAESVTLVYREEMKDRKSKFRGTIGLFVDLNRNGPSGECRLRFDGAKYRCENLPEGWQPEEPEPSDETPKTSGFRRTGSKEPRPRADVDA